MTINFISIHLESVLTSSTNSCIINFNKKKDNIK